MLQPTILRENILEETGTTLDASTMHYPRGSIPSSIQTTLRAQNIHNGAYLGAFKSADCCTLRGEVAASEMKKCIMSGQLQFLRGESKEAINC